VDGAISLAALYLTNAAWLSADTTSNVIQRPMTRAPCRLKLITQPDLDIFRHNEIS
jgi:hypothetical protein